MILFLPLIPPCGQSEKLPEIATKTKIISKNIMNYQFFASFSLYTKDSAPIVVFNYYLCSRIYRISYK